MITVISPLTWGNYTTPPPDIPECGFVGELCPPPVQGTCSQNASTWTVLRHVAMSY